MKEFKSLDMDGRSMLGYFIFEFSNKRKESLICYENCSRCAACFTSSSNEITSKEIYCIASYLVLPGVLLLGESDAALGAPLPTCIV